MNYYSTRDKSHLVSFEEAIFQSLPPDNGLYFPEVIPSLDRGFLENLSSHSREAIAMEIARPFVGNEIPENDLERIVTETVDFDFPLVQVDRDLYTLELFHGPTWAFKDCGARFLSRCMGYFTGQTNREITILVATSGDTGSAVAAGFHGIPGVKVVILYPKNKVSAIQQKQLTSWGGNISAFEVDGTFDDCQKMVKKAFLDPDLTSKFQLSSANSINIARLIPQSFYYFFAAKELEHHTDLVFSVPSGNFGNLTAGLMARKMGLSIKYFIASTNVNRTVPDYLVTGQYHPRPSIQTYANAMDVGDPSNFVRMTDLFDHDHAAISGIIKGFSLDDDDIIETIQHCYENNRYLLDPHGAVGYRGLLHYLQPGETGIFLETAHPVKFLDVVEIAIDHPLKFEEMTSGLMKKSSSVTAMSNRYAAFKERLLTS